MRSLRRSVPSIFSILLVAGLAGPVHGQEAPPPAAPGDPVCAPGPEVKEILDRVDELQAECGPSPACTDRVLAALEEGLAAHPGDLHLERELQSNWHYAKLSEERAAEKEAVLARYRALADEHPDDAVSIYLAARAEDDFDRARELFLRAIEVDPDFPWPYLGVLSVDRFRSAPADPELERRYLTAFLDRCPDQVWTAATLVRAGRTEPFWRDRVAAGRRAILEGDLAKDWRELGRTWGALYMSTPLAEQAALAPTVRAEIERVEALGLEDDDAWWQTLSQGYELIGDEEAVERIDTQRVERFPCAESVAFKRPEMWKEEHPKPDEEASEAETTAWATALWKQAVAWLAECPDGEEYWFSKLDAALSGAELSDAELDTLATDLLALSESGAFQVGTAVELLIARIFVDHEAHLDRVDELVATGLEKDLATTEKELADPLLPADLRERIAESLPAVRFNGLTLRGRAALARKDADAARGILAEGASLLDEVRPAEDAPESARQLFLGYRGGQLELSAELAALEERPADAAVLYARAAGLRPDPEEMLEKGAEAWYEAGGSAEGWQSLTEGLGAASGFDLAALRWRDKELALPADLALDAVDGTRWARADFEGKTVFVNLWATWCGPCRQELPSVEKLYAATKERDDVAVVTFNIDANPGAALRYAEKEGFTFPVLLASDLVEDMGGISGIPRSWIVDRSAVVRREQIGFGKEEGWVDEVMRMLERYAASE